MATQKEVDVVIDATKQKLQQHGLGMAISLITADQFADIAQFAIEQLDDHRGSKKQEKK